jgi:long-chain fatty acid transport protein
MVFMSDQWRNLARIALAIAAFSTMLSVTNSARGQGILMPFVGPTNQSMGGATVAAPIDSIGSLAWNPAAISGLPTSEVAVGLGLVLPTTSLSSEIPFLGLSGTTNSEPGVALVPTIGIVQHIADTPWSIGLGIFGVGGFSANYAASTTNPILLPQATAAMPLGGLGRIYARAEVFQIVPTVSYAFSERFAIGFAPTVTLAGLILDPLLIAPPNDANNDGFFSYGPGSGTRLAWGGGFQVGAYLTTESCWNFGASYKSPQWMEPFRYNSQDELGGPLFATAHFDLPAIVSLGTSYTGFERWLLATDLRYFDYANSPGFGDQGFQPDGSAAGLGWKNVLSVSQGVQYMWSDCLTLRSGYTYNQNPITSEQVMFNVASSLIIQHWLSVGMTYRWCECVSTTLAWTHGFENSVTGNLQTPAGIIPGTSVTPRVSADILNFGITVSY